MARPKEFNEEAVLGSAMLAFWRHGFHATGVQELVDATGVNRASLYGTFGNKEQFFLMALRRYTEICLAGLQTALDSGKTPLEGIRNMLDFFMGNLLETERGCLLYNTALEFSGQHASIRGEVGAGMERIEEMLVRWIGRGQAEGSIGGTTEPLLLARQAMAAMHSMTVRAGSGAPREVLQSISEGAMLLFEQNRPN